MSADYQPTASQSEAAITQLTHNLAAYDLTKGEKLQIVNLAPVEAVELYVVSPSSILVVLFPVPDFLQIVEELEDRFGDQIDTILSTVRASLPDRAFAAVDPGTSKHDGQGQPVYTEDELVYDEGTQGWDHNANDMVFDDTGEGMGVEGDLDVEDD